MLYMLCYTLFLSTLTQIQPSYHRTSYQRPYSVVNKCLGFESDRMGSITLPNFLLYVLSCESNEKSAGLIFHIKKF